MSVTRISNRKLDPICQWLVKNKFPLTLRNYLQIAYWHDVKLSELDAESIAEIPDFLLPDAAFILERIDKKWPKECLGT